MLLLRACSAPTSQGAEVPPWQQAEVLPRHPGAEVGAAFRMLGVEDAGLTTLRWPECTLW